MQQRGALIENCLAVEALALGTIPHDLRARAAVAKADADQARMDVELGADSDVDIWEDNFEGPRRAEHVVHQAGGSSDEPSATVDAPQEARSADVSGPQTELQPELLIRRGNRLMALNRR